MKLALAALLVLLGNVARAQQPAAASPAPVAASTPAPAPPPKKAKPLFYLAQHDVASFGTNEAGFVNASLGARVDCAVTPVFRIGIELAYANLEGDTDRAHSVLGLVQFEARATLNDSWSVPARIALGHLASNGATLRLASGVALKLATRLELVLEVVPMLFSTRDGVYPAVGPGLELNIRL